MESALAPTPDYSDRILPLQRQVLPPCFGERIGYNTPKRETRRPDSQQPTADRHGRPMFIISIDRQRNHHLPRVLNQCLRRESGST